MLFIIIILTLVSSAINPSEQAESFHFIINPVALVLWFVCPNIFSLSLDISILELSFINWLVVPTELTLAMLHALVVLTLIRRSIRLLFFALSTLLIIGPLPFIHCSIWFCQLTKPIALILVPTSLIYLAIRMRQLSMSNDNRINPLALKDGLIWELLPPLSMHLPCWDFPLSSVIRPIAQLDLRPTLYVDKSWTLSSEMLLYRPGWNLLNVIVIIDVIKVCSFIQKIVVHLAIWFLNCLGSADWHGYSLWLF